MATWQLIQLQWKLKVKITKVTKLKVNTWPWKWKVKIKRGNESESGKWKVGKEIGKCKWTIGWWDAYINQPLYIIVYLMIYTLHIIHYT